MGHNSVRNIDSEIVRGIACAALRHEDEIPGAIIGRSRLRGRCRGYKAGGCNHPERRRLHRYFSVGLGGSAEQTQRTSPIFEPGSGPLQISER